MTQGQPTSRVPLLVALGIGLLLAFGPGAAGALDGGRTQEPPTPISAPDEPAATTTAAPLPAASGTSIVTTLTVGGKPVEGVKVVARLDGKVAGSDESDERGEVIVEVDEPGQYEVSIDRSTLPEGVDFAAGARTTLKPIVREGAAAPVVFQLQKAGSAGSGGESRFTRVLGLLASGLRFGLVIAVASVGLSLLYGTTGLTNFAHGEILTFGAMITWAFNSGLGITLIPAAVLGVAATGVFGGALELGMFRPLRKRGMPDLSVMVASIGLAFILRYGFAIIFEANPRQYVQFAAQAPSIDLGPISLRPKDLIVIAVATVVLVAVGVFLQRSRLGTAIRAVSDDRDLSESSGIDVQRVILAVWVLSGALAGLGGVLLAVTETATWNMGQRALLIMFAAVVLGGLGTAFGAMAGGLLVGIVSDLSTYWLDADLKIVVALGALIVVLLFRPTGIFGVRARAA